MFRTFRTIAVLIPLVGLLALSSGCAVNRATANVEPGADIGRVKSFYVVKTQGDERAIDKLITDNLQKRGFTVSGGPQPSATPRGVDAVVTYNDKWMWDITMYMLELTIQFRNPSNNFPMATGNSFHTSLTRKSPPEMVDEVLTNIFNAQKK
jgi:hypothetical protein